MISATKHLKWLFILSMAFNLSTAKNAGNSNDTQTWNCKVKQESSQQVSTHLIECIREVLQPDNSEDETKSKERRSPADASKDAPEAAKQSTGSLRETTTIKPANGSEEKSESKKTNADVEATTTKSTRNTEKDIGSEDANSETKSTPEIESENTTDKVDSETDEDDAEKEETTSAKSLISNDAGSKPKDVEKTAARQIADGNASGIAAKLPRQTDRNAFLMCIGRKSGELNEDGTFNAEKTKNNTNEFNIDETVKALIEQGIDECGSANKDNVEAILGCIADTYNKNC